MKSGLLTDGIGGKSSTGPCTANQCFFLCVISVENEQDLIPKIFPGKRLALRSVMETSSVCGGSEDDRARELDIISVIGSPMVRKA